MALKQNVIKEKSEDNRNAYTRDRFGLAVVEVLEQESNPDWQDIQEFAREHFFE